MIGSRLWILIVVLLVTFLPCLSAAGTVYLPRTGQTTCYDPNTNAVTPCEGTGEDGEIQAGFPWPSLRFTPHKDGTVVDNLTGLIWLRRGDCFTGQWFGALAFASNLASGQCGLSDGSVAGDWRLPNINELESLFNVADAIPYRVFNELGFTNMNGNNYWSSTTLVNINAVDTGKVFCVNGSNGHVPDQPKTYQQPALAVRGSGRLPVQTWKTGQTVSYGSRDDGELEVGVPWPSERFTDKGDGTVSDNLTGLVWLKRANCFGQTTWKNALAFANTLAGGQCGLSDGSAAGDWRLPNRKELWSLVDHSRSQPVLPNGHPFLDIGSLQTFWSSSTVASTPTSAWCLGLEWGRIDACAKATYPPYDKNVWPVRSGIRGAVVISASPTKGGDTGSVSVTIHGSGFADGASVKLTRAGESDVLATPVVFRDQNTLTASFDLRGKARGVWDVLVANPGAPAVTLGEAFTIEEGVFPKMWTDILGRDVIVVGRPQTLTFFAGNEGNIDARCALILKGIPKSATVEVLYGEVVKRHETAEEAGYLFSTRIVPPGGSILAAKIRLIIPADLGTFSLSAQWTDN